VIQRIRALAKKTEPQMVSLDINDVIREAISLDQREVLSQRVSLRTEHDPIAYAHVRVGYGCNMPSSAQREVPPR
jgi:hypothetical protein